jgi:LuxR family transcriptional regulator, maltose regulon positive regulatory protein
MSAPILATKLYIPPPRSKIVLRPRLIERLNEGLQRTASVALISASAGFGKTTLISEWVATLTPGPSASGRGAGLRVAWLSLDAGDNDPARFLVYLVAALQTIAPKMGDRVLEALQSSQPPSTEALLTTLLNEITTLSDNFSLVLDDYHVIDSQPLDQALTFLVEHLPPQMHLVIASREDPPLPLARLRVRGQLTELRAADLRFTAVEAADFLNRVMGLNLAAEDVAALENRTEGWIAGLQLAALSLQGQADATRFIQSFTGSHRFVLDYLVEEVLRRQPEYVRSFLLQTSILERLCGPLCDAVCSVGTAGTGQADSRVMLEALERGNLFVIPLDDGRQWYRYHQLFAEVLQSHLREAQADRVAALHLRASAWYERNNLPADAIHHALAGEDFERAAELLERVWLAMDLNYQSALWLNWVKALPDELIRARPVVSLGYAWALLNGGELEASEARLRDAERWLEPAGRQSQKSSLKMVVVDEAEFRSLPASIASARAYRALALGDIPGTIVYARQALTLAPEGDLVRRTQATALLGMAEYAGGDLQAAERSLLDFQASMWQAGDIASALGITFILANIWMVQGRLRQAVGAYQQALHLAASRDAPLPIGTSDLYRGLSEVLCEQGELEAAAQHLLTAEKLGEHAALTGWPHRLGVAQARMTEARGDLAGALALLDEAERQYVRNPLPDRSIAALKARVWIRQGKLTEAAGWAHAQGLSPADDLSYLREFEHLTLARLLIARHKTDRVDDALRAALGLLERLLQAAEVGNRTGSVIEILLLQALAHHAQGGRPRALASLERALALAEPEGYVQVFVDEGQPMRFLILDSGLRIEKQKRDQNQKTAGYVEKLLAALTQPTTRLPSPTDNRPSAMVEPLSERELEVLKLLGTELSGPEIARELSVSLNTVRTHTKNIYSKLGANNRRAAIRRAEELDLL